MLCYEWRVTSPKEMRLLYIVLTDLMFIGIAVAAYVNELYYFLAVSTIFLVIFSLMLWCYWSQLEIAFALIVYAKHFFKSNKRIFFLSVFYFLLTIAVFLFTIGSAFYVYSMSDCCYLEEP